MVLGITVARTAGWVARLHPGQAAGCVGLGKPVTARPTKAEAD